MNNFLDPTANKTAAVTKLLCINDFKSFVKPSLPYTIAVTTNAPTAGSNEPQKLVGNLNARIFLLDRIISSHKIHD
ncbi:MAG: hypothetical protein M1391_08755 [Bacteroidetes bacterium]|nr:hypothetical protein [Bacteroidota bacterium]